MKTLLFFSPTIFQALALLNPNANSFTIVIFLALVSFKIYLAITNKALPILGLAFLSYVEISFSILYPLSHISPGEINFLNDLQQQAYLLLGAMIFSLISLTTISFIRLRASLKINEFQNISIPFREEYLLGIFTLVAFGVSVVANIFGLGKMGGDGITLPFKMAGMINVARIWLIPYLFVVIYYLVKGKKTTFCTVALFVLWSILESYLRMSRGVVLRNLLPFFIIIYLKDFKISTRLVLVLFLTGILSLSAFTIADTMRQLNYLKKDITVSSIITRTKHRVGIYNSIPYYISQRLFPNGLEVSKYLRDNPLNVFEFQWGRFVKWRGNSMYHTRVLDGVSEKLANSQHNSGIGGMSDAFYLFGVSGLLIITILFLGFYLCIDIIIKEQVLSAMMVVFSFDLLFGGLGTFSYAYYGSFLLRIFFPMLIVLHVMLLKSKKIKILRGS